MNWYSIIAFIYGLILIGVSSHFCSKLDSSIAQVDCSNSTQALNRYGAIFCENYSYLRNYDIVAIFTGVLILAASIVQAWSSRCECNTTQKNSSNVPGYSYLVSLVLLTVVFLALIDLGSDTLYFRSTPDLGSAIIAVIVVSAFMVLPGLLLLCCICAGRRFERANADGSTENLLP